ncbi:hypothetical protein FA13DRAFT_1756533 [Coprinellus micaceus]|uniref:Helicase ATP-binding domain-containing protein n=1 Tax=Coprinellus micaceus TaxID=71717 RepID=A0A4Y7SV87_COPMI|nr:hypothetical protein FA13DRAFT_1756533 [Coprinellus micaceus]
MSSVATSPLPSTFDETELPTSTAASSPPTQVTSLEDDEQDGATFDEVNLPTQLKKLQDILAKSTLYSNFLRERMEEDRRRTLEESQQQTGKKRGRPSGPDTKGKKRAKKGHAIAEDANVFEQPALISGATLKPYQLEGLQWMVSLDKNGISGILADEMGLGQGAAYLREHQNARPFLIVCPLSVLHNWVSEYQKFAPSIPVCMYHGTPEERAEMRRTVMALPEDRPKLTRNARAAEDRLRRHRRNAKSQCPTFLWDRVHLSKYNWGYIVVDEGHRLKNLNCKLMKEIKQYHSAGRMILTGTPLHNNLAELWSLLNFILPDIFDDIDAFQELFNLPQLQETLPAAQSQEIITTLHGILKPFLLRRLKVDVELNLPPKKEYVLYAPLSVRQREAYDRVLDGDLRSWLIGGGTAAEKEEDSEEEDENKTKRSLRRRRGKKFYDVDGDDDEYFDKLERGEVDERGYKRKLSRAEEEAEQLRVVLEHQARQKVKQLRKVCSHPFLFDWPIDKKTREPVLGEELVNASGKMMVLDRLLRELFRRDHKVLLFSQFTTMLDIIEDWAVDFMGWSICRIDGTSSPLERKGARWIASRLQDTVIFYDQDWNPQMDAQAQDRAHRIGQTKPVLIFRLLSAHTVETKIMQRATEKRKLEALVIAKAAATTSSKRETIAEMAASLLRLEGEKIEVVPNTKEGKASLLSDKDLNMLLDRSPEVFADRGKDSSPSPSATSSRRKRGARVAEAKGTRAAFAVYDAPVDEGSDALAKMFGEDINVGDESVDA